MSKASSNASAALLGTRSSAFGPSRSNEQSMGWKLAVAVLAPLLLVSAFICFVLHAGTSQFIYEPSQGDTDRAEGYGIAALYPDEVAGISAIAKSVPSGRPVSSICQHTAFPGVCERELSGFRIPQTTSPLEVLSFAVQAAARRVDEAHVLAVNSSNEGGLSVLEDQCANDCVELMLAAKEQLTLVAAHLPTLRGLSDAASLSNALADVKVWLSSSLSYQSACSDNFQVAPGSIQQRIQSNQAYLTQVLGVSLGLVHTLSTLGNSVDSWLAALPSATHFHRRRRLLLHNEPSFGSFLNVEEDGDFPTWVSASDRRLLRTSVSAVAADAIVAKDGSGNYTTVSAALNAIPSSRSSGRYVIYIKKGVYNEVFNLSTSLKNVTFLGDGIGKTIITGDRNVASGDYNTYRTSTVGISASGFYARDLTIRNTAGASGYQAVALRAGADYQVFYRCSFEGFQDTLYALSSRQFYRECQIYGTVDFIFGNAIAVFQTCILWARLPLSGQQNTYTAQGRQLADDITGYSFHNCTVTADATLSNASYTVLTYLGRPWKAYSRVVFMQSELQSVVQPAGYLEWNSSNPFTTTLYYGEYSNRGAGANTSQRVSWTGVHPNMSKSDAANFTVANFIGIQSWLSALQVPYQANLL